ncbi:hypothetical protein [Azotosporobacter soli]|uniref:hypothetical protein n=1 Tax=Azotosporobacter soli TaxID=3055040 RepID=UPI0031FE8EEB
MKLVKLLSIGFLVMIVWMYFVWHSEEGKIRETRLVAEYQALQQPPGAEVVFYRLERKIIMRWIFSCYKYPMKTEEVIGYYNQRLKEQGWQKKERPMRDGHIELVYAKENLAFSLLLNDDNTWTVSMSYEDAHY